MDFIEGLRHSEAVEAIVQAAGEGVLARAKQGAEAVKDSGAFARSMRGKMFTSRRRGPKWYRVWSTDPASLSIEFGTAKQDGKHVLGNAIRGA
jgi:photosystem II stability/assembly factor-like uncharacterized protein